MDIVQVGKAIAYLRKAKGYTQKELANHLGISDKAVSRWERGIGTPDISFLAKLSIVLDTDIESLLEGNASHYRQMWKGILILDDNISSGIFAGSYIFDKPLIFYLLSPFLLIGIKDILIVSGIESKQYIERELGNGQELGIYIDYYIKKETDKLYAILNNNQEFIQGYHLAISYGNTIFYGIDLTKFCQRAMARKENVTILCIQGYYGKNADKAIFNKDKKIVTGNHNLELMSLHDNYYQAPLLFCTKDILKEISISYQDIDDFIYNLRKEEKLYAELIGRGMVLLPIKSSEDILDASNFVRILQKTQGNYIACIEEIAWRRGLISKTELELLGKKKEHTVYGKYILGL